MAKQIVEGSDVDAVPVPPRLRDRRNAFRSDTLGNRMLTEVIGGSGNLAT
jgi:hypothetical protein